MTIATAPLAWDGTIAISRSPDQWGMKGAPATTGLTYGYIGGVAFNVSGVQVLIADSTITLTDNAVNYVERTFSGTVSVNTSGFTASKLPMAKITTASGAITACEDRRVRHGQGPFIASGTGAVARMLNDKIGELTLSVKDFGAVGDDTTNDYAAITAAITAVSNAGGGVVFFPRGNYLSLSMIAVPKNVRLVGVNPSGVAPTSAYGGLSVIRGKHTSAGILDFRGTQGAGIIDLTVYGDAATTPKTGLLLGRTSSASAGFHRFSNPSVTGYYSVAPIYSIASEENVWDHPFVYLQGGGAKYCFATAQDDWLAVGGLTASSNIHCTVNGFEAISEVDDANASMIFIRAGASTFNWKFDGGYLIPKSGSYVTIDTGRADASDSPGPYMFIGMSGEIKAGGTNKVLTGYNLTSNGAFNLRGFIVIGAKMQIDATTPGFFLRQDATLLIKDAMVRVTNAMGVGSSLDTTRIALSIIDTGSAVATQIYSDIDTGGNSILGPSANTKGYYFGPSGPRFRYQSGVPAVQLTDNSGAGFFDLMIKSPGFYGTNPPASQGNVTGSRGGNAALASLLTKLAATGIITDGSTP